MREARLHDARHAAATVLMLLGIPDRVIDQIMGWEAGTSSGVRALPARAGRHEGGGTEARGCHPGPRTECACGQRRRTTRAETTPKGPTANGGALQRIAR